jgi:hypothetical protein
LKQVTAEQLGLICCAAAAHPLPVTGVMYIFGLNFKKGDVALAKNQMDTIFREIPYYAIMSFELGNEVRSQPELNA